MRGYEPQVDHTLWIISIDPLKISEISSYYVLLTRRETCCSLISVMSQVAPFTNMV